MICKIVQKLTRMEEIMVSFKLGAEPKLVAKNAVVLPFYNLCFIIQHHIISF